MALTNGDTELIGARADVRRTVRKTAVDVRTRSSDLILGTSSVIESLRRDIERIASRSSAPPTLIVGPSGSGKDLVARALHAASERAHRPFVAVNCAAISATLFESEVFGHERGAFTGATERRTGFAAAAHGGVLFFDEIGDLPLPQQAKLLRLVETRSLRAVGSDDERPVDVWFVTATNRDLDERVREGLFREDLYYRLSGVILRTPSIADRREDIPELVRAFIERGAPDLVFEEGAFRWLEKRDWPGNVRELKSFVDRVAIFAESTVVDESELVALDRRERSSETRLRAGQATFESLARELLRLEGDLPMKLAALEKVAVGIAIDNNAGNASAAARSLGMDRTSMTRRLR